MNPSIPKKAKGFGVLFLTIVLVDSGLPLPAQAQMAYQAVLPAYSGTVTLTPAVTSLKDLKTKCIIPNSKYVGVKAVWNFNTAPAGKPKKMSSFDQLDAALAALKNQGSKADQAYLDSLFKTYSNYNSEITKISKNLNAPLEKACIQPVLTDPSTKMPVPNPTVVKLTTTSETALKNATAGFTSQIKLR